MAYKLALQLYSIREDFEQDYIGTLKKVSELGFEGVEFAGFYNIEAKILKEILQEYGLEVAGSHTSYDLLLNHLDEVISYNKKIGNKHIICPWCEFSTREKLEDIIINFNWISQRLLEQGMYLSYHNHSQEFEKIEDTYILDYIFENCPSILPELDVYWIYQGGENEIEYVKKYKEKMKLLHLKDGTRSKGTALFEGEVDLMGVLKEVESSNITWLVIEDETKYPMSMDSVSRSINNFKSRIKKI